MMILSDDILIILINRYPSSHSKIQTRAIPQVSTLCIHSLTQVCYPSPSLIYNNITMNNTIIMVYLYYYYD